VLRFRTFQRRLPVIELDQRGPLAHGVVDARKDLDYRSRHGADDDDLLARLIVSTIVPF
jgi:hypothetical protein